MHCVAVGPKARDSASSRGYSQPLTRESMAADTLVSLGCTSEEAEIVDIGPDYLCGAYLCQLGFDHVGGQNQNEDQEG